MRLDLYNRTVKEHDRDLFVARNLAGTLCVFRKSKRFVPVCIDDDFKLLNLVESKDFVTALTHNWSARGIPTDWGSIPLLERLKEIDFQHNERLMEEMDLLNEKIDQSKKRSMRNELEAFWSDNRRAFVKATDEILVHSLSKDEPKKRLREKRVKNGNY